MAEHHEFGKSSERELNGVHPKLVAVTRRALRLCEEDFGVIDGTRTEEEQADYVKRGVSKTLKSMHLPQEDGFSWAVDNVPYINGRYRWEWAPIYKVAAAMRKAAIELDADIIWGGVWDRKLRDLPETPEGIRQAMLEYNERHPGEDFNDGPHYQLASV